jgi:FkbM family methyltransferase
VSVPLLSRLVRLYTFHTPIRRGRHRLADVALARWRDLPSSLEVVTRDGDRLVVDPRSTMWRYAYFHGEYEPALSRLVARVVRPGDVCLDIGANIGWYTVLLARLAGPAGTVHAFEPNPPVFARLEENLRLAGSPATVVRHLVALGNARGTAKLHVFAGVADGHASLSAQGRDDFATVTCPVRPLDDVLEEAHTGPVAFAKMDVEGSERSVLEGAPRLLAQRVPPVWLIEMARATSRTFGYGPDALVALLRASGPTRFFAVDEARGRLGEIRGFAPGDVGANVLCVPEARADLLETLRDGARV